MKSYLTDLSIMKCIKLDVLNYYLQDQARLHEQHQARLHLHHHGPHCPRAGWGHDSPSLKRLFISIHQSKIYLLRKKSIFKQFQNDYIKPSSPFSQNYPSKAPTGYEINTHGGKHQRKSSPWSLSNTLQKSIKKIQIFLRNQIYSN